MVVTRLSRGIWTGDEEQSYCPLPSPTGRLSARNREMPSTKFRATKKNGKVSLVLDVKEYEKLVEDLEELDEIRAYDAAKQSGETPIPFEEMMKNIQASRK